RRGRPPAPAPPAAGHGPQPPRRGHRAVPHQRLAGDQRLGPDGGGDGGGHPDLHAGRRVHVLLRPALRPVPAAAGEEREVLSRARVMVVFGTRPEATKMAPVVRELERHPGMEPIVTVTAQHREMLDQVLRLFRLPVHHDLDIMRPRQSLTDVTVRVLEGLERLLEAERPDVVLVHGDTATTAAASLAAFYA